VIDYETEETGPSLRAIKSARDLLEEDFSDDTRLLLFWTSVLNHYALIQSSFSELENALKALDQSKHLYLKWKQNPDQKVLQLEDAFLDVDSSPDDETKINLEAKIEKNYTETIYFMAQVLQNLGQNDKSAILCMETLKRQAVSGEFDPLDWAVNAATFCQYFASHGDFSTARHLLASAMVMIDKVNSSDDELFTKRRHDLDRIFVKYCLMLMESHSSHSTVPSSCSTDRVLEYSVVLEIEESIPVSVPTMYEDAILIFQAAQRHLSDATSYFTLETHASDYADCILDESKLYRLLALFQTQDVSKVCKLHKRRIDLLEHLVKELNPTHFLALLSKINFELGETYSEMAHYKSIEKSCENLSKQVVIKINSFINHSINHFDKFLATFSDKTTKEIKGKLDDEEVRPVISALMSRGRLNSKFLTLETGDQLKKLEESESAYQRAVNYLSLHSDQEDLVQEEAKVLREMLQLIPDKRRILMTNTMY